MRCPECKAQMFELLDANLKPIRVYSRVSLDTYREHSIERCPKCHHILCVDTMKVKHVKKGN